MLEWPAYYDQLQATFAPPLPVPRGVVDELRRRIPPRQIVLADPRYSCALVVLIDAYCINPASIYGHYFQPAAAYFRDYVKERGSDPPEHPFFNATTSVSDAERPLIQQFHVTYVLTDPEFEDLIASKLTHRCLGNHVSSRRGRLSVVSGQRARSQNASPIRLATTRCA